MLRSWFHPIDTEGLRAGDRIADAAEALLEGVLVAIRGGATDALSLEDELYRSPAGPISPLDVIYGYHREIETGNPFYAHKTGFTPKLLPAALHEGGFRHILVATAEEEFEIRALAFKEIPGPEVRALLSLPENVFASARP